MFYGFNVHWLVVPVMVIIALLALWACHKVAGKLGLYLFNILALSLCNLMPSFEIFGVNPSVGVVFVFFSYIALLICFKQYGERECTKLLMTSLVALVATFALKFVLAIVMSASGEMFLNWQNFGDFIGSILSFTLATLIGYLFVRKNAQLSYLKSACMLCVVMVCDVLLFTIISQAFITVEIRDFLVEVAIKWGLAIVLAICAPAYARLFEDKPQEDSIEKEEKEEESATEQVQKSAPTVEEDQEVKEEKPKKTSSKKTAEEKTSVSAKKSTSKTAKTSSKTK